MHITVADTSVMDVRGVNRKTTHTTDSNDDKKRARISKDSNIIDSNDMGKEKTFLEFYYWRSSNESRIQSKTKQQHETRYLSQNQIKRLKC